jgi:polysaccharide biosynthesis transport protein
MSTNVSQDQHLLSSTDPPPPQVRDYLIALARAKWLIAATLLLFLIVGAVYLHFASPAYEASARVLIDEKSREGGASFFDLFGTTRLTKSTNEIEVLGSHSLAVDVASALLQRRFLNELDQQPIPIILAENGKPPDSLFADSATIAAELQSTMEFVPIKESEVIKITARRHNPEEAALLANTYAERYVQRDLLQSRTRSRAIREYLQQELTIKKKALEEAERNLQEYMRVSGVVTLDAEIRKVVEQLSQLEASRDAVGMEISSAMKVLASYEHELKTQEPRAAETITASNDAYIRLLQEQLAKLEVTRDVTIAQNPSMVSDPAYTSKLREQEGQIALLRKNLAQRTQDYLTTLLPGERNAGGDGSAGYLSSLKQRIVEKQIDLEGLRARRAALDGAIRQYDEAFGRIPQKSIELAKHQRAQLSSEKLYLLVEEKYNEAAIKETAEFGSVNIVDRAVTPRDPVSPRVMFTLILSGLAGLFLGIMLALLRSVTRVKANTPEELIHRGFNPMATVKTMSFAGLRHGATMTVPSHGRMLDIHLVTHLYPYSSAAESFRHLRTGIDFARADKQLRHILITSPSRGDGKTVVAANLALAFAQADKSVLLIDADLRRPRLHTLFELPPDPGFADVMLHGKLAMEVIVARVLPNLDVLPSGVTPRHPSEALGSKKLKQFLDEMDKVYDTVIFDAPPLLPVTDASILAPHVDAVVLVAGSGQTPMAALARSRDILQQVRAPLLGVVLNRFSVRKAYGGYRAGSGYGYMQPDREYYRTPGDITTEGEST